MLVSKYLSLHEFNDINKSVFLEFLLFHLQLNKFHLISIQIKITKIKLLVHSYKIDKTLSRAYNNNNINIFILILHN